MFANVERERERESGWCRHIKVNIPSAERERERSVCSFWISSGFFYSGNSSTYFKVCVDLCKKSDRTRCLAFSILEYNINSNSKSAERAKAFWFSEGRTK